MMTMSAKQMEDFTEIDEERFEESDVRKYYAGKTVFLTGSTGFMGKCLVEKLLRGCPKLKRIYILVRPKKGSSAGERLQKYFDDVVFSTVRQSYPDFTSKIHLVEGDLMQNDMGLSEKDKITMIDEVNIIFHNASNVKFSERMSTALKINVLGTKAMLDLAKQCKHIEGFLYVSTAYSHCYQKNIMEEAYPSPADMKMVEDLVAADLASPTGLNKAYLSNILGKFPNTYTFTKAIAEGLVNDATKQTSFPCIVFRPSVVLSTWKEPFSGWADNLNGPVMLLFGYALGILHVGYKRDNVIDFIPADISINAMLVSIWDAVNNRSNERRSLVYNYGSSAVKPISMGSFHELNPIDSNGSLLQPSIHQLYHTCIIYVNNLWCFAFLFVSVHIVPAIIADAYLLFKGKKPKALPAFKKGLSYWKLIVYFIDGEWSIDISEMNKVVDRMSSVDRKLFFCDIRELDWPDYFSTYAGGFRQYIMKDPPSTIPAAKRKARLLMIIHNTVKYMLILLIVYVFATKLGLL